MDFGIVWVFIFLDGCWVFGKEGVEFWVCLCGRESYRDLYGERERDRDRAR